MPEPIQVLTHLIPSRYFVTILKNVYLKGAGLEIIWAEAVFLFSLDLQKYRYKSQKKIF